MVREVVRDLVVSPDGTYVDGTAGSGGHGEAIARALSDKGRLICLDRDPEAVSLAAERLSFLGGRVRVAQADFAEMDRVLGRMGVTRVQGVLLDLGMSSHQIEASGRGFSFLRDEPLDMRMDPGGGTTAHDLINGVSLEDLERILREYGEERRARRIARAIVKAREEAPIRTSRHLAAVVASACPRPRGGKARRHPATRTFQALRIAVNRELESLEAFLDKAPGLLTGGGRLVILSYHSLEDRRVKRAMAGWEKGCTCPPDFPQCVCGGKPLFKRIRKKGLKPGASEVGENPRARSAVLRAAERILS